MTCGRPCRAGSARRRREGSGTGRPPLSLPSRSACADERAEYGTDRTSESTGSPRSARVAPIASATAVRTMSLTVTPRRWAASTTGCRRHLHHGEPPMRSGGAVERRARAEAGTRAAHAQVAHPGPGRAGTCDQGRHGSHGRQAGAPRLGGQAASCVGGTGRQRVWTRQRTRGVGDRGQHGEAADPVGEDVVSHEDEGCMVGRQAGDPVSAPERPVAGEPPAHEVSRQLPERVVAVDPAEAQVPVDAEVVVAGPVRPAAEERRRAQALSQPWHRCRAVVDRSDHLGRVQERTTVDDEHRGDVHRHGTSVAGESGQIVRRGPVDTASPGTTQVPSPRLHGSTLGGCSPAGANLRRDVAAGSGTTQRSPSVS